MKTVNGRVRGLNLLIYLLISTQVLLLIYVISMLVFSVVQDVLSMITSVSAVLLFLVSLPLTVMIYLSSPERDVRTMDLGLMTSVAMVSISGIIWYVISPTIDAVWLIGVAKVILGLAYIPYMIAALGLLKCYHTEMDKNTVYFFASIDVLASLLLLYITAANWYWSDFLGAVVFLFSVLMDISILSIFGLLITTVKKQETLSFLLVNFCYMIFFFIGDARQLLGFVGLLPAIDYYAIVYDSAFIFLSLSLLLYFINMVRESGLNDVNKKLNNTRLFMDSLIMESPDAVCIFDHGGDLVQVNDRFAGMFKISQSELPGNYNLFKDPEVFGIPRCDSLDGLRRGKCLVMPMIRPSGDIFNGRSCPFLSVKAFSAHDSDGNIMGYVAILEDISNRVRLENDLRDAYERLKKEYDRRIDFTNMAAHELRTPLTPIIGYTEISRSMIDDPRIKNYLEIVERNAWRQKKIVDRMLELSRIDSGAMKLNYGPVDVSELFKDLIVNYGVSEHIIRFNVEDGMTILTDPEKLYQILDNLLSNAVKYSVKGSDILLSAGKDGDCYVFSVKDNGPGIPEEDFDLIFERFYLIDGGKDVRTTGRTGLGLALVKGYVTLLGGKVWLESTVGKGSTFYFTLPVR